MPPWHLLVHTPHFGAGAVAGALVGGFLGWPTLHVDLVAGSIEYQDRLGLFTSADVNSGYGVAFMFAVVGAALGAAIGALLVSLRVVTKEDLEL
jgi:hypothetical protein